MPGFVRVPSGVLTVCVGSLSPQTSRYVPERPSLRPLSVSRHSLHPEERGFLLWSTVTKPAVSRTVTKFVDLFDPSGS